MSDYSWPDAKITTYTVLNWKLMRYIGGVDCWILKNTKDTDVSYYNYTLIGLLFDYIRSKNK